METFVLMSHNDGAMQSGDCRLFPDKASAYSEMLNDIRQMFCEEKPVSDEDVRRTFEEHGGTLDHDSADVEYFGVTYEWKIQECDFLLETEDNGLHLDIPADEQPEFFGQIIDCFDDFLEEQDVRLPRSVKEMEEDEAGDGNDARIYGSDYDDLDSKIQETIKSWAKTEDAQ